MYGLRSDTRGAPPSLILAMPLRFVFQRQNLEYVWTCFNTKDTSYADLATFF